MRVLGRFLPDALEVPWSLVEFIAGQLGVEDASVVKRYGARRATPYEHSQEITRRYGYLASLDAPGRPPRAGTGARRTPTARLRPSDGTCGDISPRKPHRADGNCQRNGAHCSLYETQGGSVRVALACGFVHVCRPADDEGGGA